MNVEDTNSSRVISEGVITRLLSHTGLHLGEVSPQSVFPTNLEGTRKMVHLTMGEKISGQMC